MSAPAEPRILVEGGPVHRRVNHILAGLVGFVIGTGCALGYVLVALHGTSITNCQQIELVKGAERETIAEAAHLTATTKGQTAEQRAQGVVFFRDALDRLKPRQC